MLEVIRESCTTLLATAFLMNCCLAYVAGCSFIYEECKEKTVKLLWIIIFAGSGALVLLIFLVTMICFCRKHKKRRKHGVEAKDPEDKSQMLQPISTEARQGEGLYEEVNQGFTPESLEPCPSSIHKTVDRSATKVSKGSDDQENSTKSSSSCKKKKEENKNDPAVPLYAMVDKSKKKKKQSLNEEAKNEVPNEQDTEKAKKDASSTSREKHDTDEKLNPPLYENAETIASSKTKDVTDEGRNQIPSGRLVEVGGNANENVEDIESNQVVLTYAVVDKCKKGKRDSMSKEKTDRNSAAIPVDNVANTDGVKQGAGNNIQKPSSSYAVVDKSKKSKRDTAFKETIDRDSIAVPVGNAANTEDAEQNAETIPQAPTYAVVDKSKKSKNNTTVKAKNNQTPPKHTKYDSAPNDGGDAGKNMNGSDAIEDKSRKSKTKNRTEGKTGGKTTGHPTEKASNTVSDNVRVTDKNKNSKKKSLTKGVADRTLREHSGENAHEQNVEETQKEPNVHNNVSATSGADGRKTKNSKKRSFFRGNKDKAPSNAQMKDGFLADGGKKGAKNTGLVENMSKEAKKKSWTMEERLGGSDLATHVVPEEDVDNPNDEKNKTEQDLLVPPYAVVDLYPEDEEKSASEEEDSDSPSTDKEGTVNKSGKIDEAQKISSGTPDVSVKASRKDPENADDLQQSLEEQNPKTAEGLYSEIEVLESQNLPRISASPKKSLQASKDLSSERMPRERKGGDGVNERVSTGAANSGEVSNTDIEVNGKRSVPRKSPDSKTLPTRQRPLTRTVDQPRSNKRYTADKGCDKQRVSIAAPENIATARSSSHTKYGTDLLKESGCADGNRNRQANCDTNKRFSTYGQSVTTNDPPPSPKYVNISELRNKNAFT